MDFLYQNITTNDSSFYMEKIILYAKIIYETFLQKKLNNERFLYANTKLLIQIISPPVHAKHKFSSPFSPNGHDHHKRATEENIPSKKHNLIDSTTFQCGFVGRWNKEYIRVCVCVLMSVYISILHIFRYSYLKDQRWRK